MKLIAMESHRWSGTRREWGVPEACVRTLDEHVVRLHKIRLNCGVGKLRSPLEHRLDYPSRHVADVSIAMTARCEPGRLRNDAGFIEGWMVMVMVGLLPSALVNGIV